MAHGNFEVGVHRPADLQATDWEHLRTFELDAFRTGGFSEAEAGALIFAGECRGNDRYVQSRSNPQAEVHNSLRGGQHISEPRIVLARRNDAIIGSMSVALHNTSGNALTRVYKRYIGDGSRDYVWVQGLAVAEGYRRQRVATEMGLALFSSLRVVEQAAHRPMAAYVYEERTPYIGDFLEEITFERTGARQVNLGGSALMLARYAAPTVQGVSEALLNVS